MAVFFSFVFITCLHSSRTPANTRLRALYRFINGRLSWHSRRLCLVLACRLRPPPPLSVPYSRPFPTTGRLEPCRPPVLTCLPRLAPFVLINCEPFLFRFPILSSLSCSSSFLSFPLPGPLLRSSGHLLCFPLPPSAIPQPRDWDGGTPRPLCVVPRLPSVPGIAFHRTTRNSSCTVPFFSPSSVLLSLCPRRSF